MSEGVSVSDTMSRVNHDSEDDDDNPPTIDEDEEDDDEENDDEDDTCEFLEFHADTWPNLQECFQPLYQRSLVGLYFRIRC